MQKAKEIVLECATEVEEIWKLDRGMGGNSPVPNAQKKITILLFCPNLRQKSQYQSNFWLAPHRK